MCEHANVVLKDGETIADNIPEAQPVPFDPEGVVERAKAVAANGHLGSNDVSQIDVLYEDATSSRVALLVRLGNTETFAVRHVSRSVPGSWAHVQTTDIARPAGSSPHRSARRRSTENEKIQCKVKIAWVGAEYVGLPYNFLLTR